MPLKGLKPAERKRDFANFVLMAMNLTGYRMYEGTVPDHVKARRRAKNRAARKSRRINRNG